MYIYVVVPYRKRTLFNVSFQLALPLMHLICQACKLALRVKLMVHVYVGMIHNYQFCACKSLIFCVVQQFTQGQCQLPSVDNSILIRTKSDF